MFTGSLGCAAFLFGALFSVMLFAPSFLGDPVAYYVEETLSERIVGRVHITSLSLAWDSRQRATDVILHDEDGTEIAWMTVSFPSILDLFNMADTWTTEARLQVNVSKADLIVGEDGITNLERALAPADEPAPLGTVMTAEEARDRAGPLVLDLTCELASWTDTRDPDLAVSLSDVSFSLERQWSGLTAKGSMNVASDSSGLLEFDWEVVDPFTPNWGQVDGTFKATSLPTDFVDSALDSGGLLGELFGATLDPTLTIKGDMQTGAAVRGTLVSAAANGEFSAQYAAGVLTTSEDGLEMRLRVPYSLCEAHQVPFMPESVRLRRPSDGDSWLVRSRDFALPLGLGTAAGFDKDALIAGLRGKVTLVPAGPFVVWAGQDEVGELEPERLTVQLLDEGVLSSEFLTEVQGMDGVEGAFSMELLAPFGLTALLADAEWPAPLSLSVDSSGLPTQLVDDLASQGGLLVDALGPTAALTVEASWPVESAPCSAVLTSDNAEVSWSGDWREGRLVADAESGLDARLSLTPDFCERVVGSLAPWMRIRHGSSDGPVQLTLRDVAAPLDGDLSRLSASVHLELGVVEYSLAKEILGLIKVPGAEHLAGATMQKALIPPFDVRIENGVVQYDGLSLDTQKRMQDVKGTLDLVTGQVSIEAKMPLSLLGELSGLESVAGVHVPVVLTGDWSSPKVSVEAGAVKNLMKDGLDALMEGILSGRFKKKD